MYQHNDYIENFDLDLLAPAGMPTVSIDDSSSFQLETVGFTGSNTAASIEPSMMLEKLMQYDKQATLSSLVTKQQHQDESFTNFGEVDSEWLEASSSLKELMDLAGVEEVKEEVEEDPEALIVEMEEFLGQFENSVPQQNFQEEDSFLQQDDGCPLSSTRISDDDKLAAEQIIDELFKNTIELEDMDSLSVLDDVTPEFADVTPAPELDSGFNGSSILSSTEMIMADGTKVIFVVTNDLDEAKSSILEDKEDEDMSPASTAEFDDDESDESWSPAPTNRSSSSKASQPRRRSTERKTSSSTSGFRRARLAGVDKKERKKIQNVEAARRYRDKKKSEQQLLDEELEELVTKNKSLKSMASEKEAELKTLKKLMVELGIIKAKKRC